MMVRRAFIGMGVAGWLLAAPAAAGGDAATSVLVLYAQSQILHAVIEADDSIRAVLGASTSPSVRIYTEYLDTSAFPDRESELALSVFLRRKYEAVPLDLVMAGGGQALRFAVAHRARLFPHVPIVFFGVNRRGDLEAAQAPGVTGVWLAPDPGATLDAALRLQPAVRRVFVAGGTAAVDRLHRDDIRWGLERHAGRVEITELPDVPLEALVRDVAALPGDGILLLGSMHRDGARRVVVPAEAAARLAQAASVPAYALFEAYVGRGAVGGRVVSFRVQGWIAADLALGLLRGDEALAAPRTGEEVNRWAFDWRELRRWGLDARLLPEGSEVRHRIAPAWEPYQWHIAASAILLVLQCGLIAGLLVTRSRRRSAERALAERVSFEELLAELSGAFNALPAAAVDSTVEHALRRVVEALGVDRVTLGELMPPDRGVSITHVSTAPGIARVPARLGRSEFPWTAARLHRGEIVHFARLADLPADAATDRRSFVRFGTRSFVGVPLMARGSNIGMMTLSAMTAERAWPSELLDRLHLMAEIFAGALLQRRAEAALRESEDRFRLMADHAPVMVWMSAVDTRCTYVNRRWLEFTGRRAEDELGDGWVQSVHAEDRPRCVAVYGRAFAEQSEFLMEYRLRRQDGEYRCVLDQGVPRFAADGTFAGFVGSCVDVTDLRAAERTLLESKLLGAAIFTSLHGQVAAIDKKGVIIAVNDAWVREGAERGADAARVSAGVSYLEECGRAVRAGDPQAKYAVEAIEAVLAGHRPHASVEYACAGPADRRWFQMLVEPLRRPEGGAVISHIDVTDRRRAEDEVRRRRQELAHAQRLSTTGELAASLAHEINQPLLAIMSNAQAADRLLEGPVPDLAEARAALEDIASDAQRAAEVIRALRGMVGKHAGPHDEIDVNDLVSRVARLVRHDVERREIALRVDLGTDLPAVRGDAVQLQQVVLNLLLNASEALAGEDLVARDIRLVTWRTGTGDARIDVVDTGPGVPEDQLERMFVPFVTTKPDGLGLGLSISRSIVEAHGGRIGAAHNTRAPASPSTSCCRARNRRSPRDRRGPWSWSPTTIPRCAAPWGGSCARPGSRSRRSAPRRRSWRARSPTGRCAWCPTCGCPATAASTCSRGSARRTPTSPSSSSPGTATSRPACAP